MESFHILSQYISSGGKLFKLFLILKDKNYLLKFKIFSKTYKHTLLGSKDRFILGFYNLISRICAEKSLKYVDFIMKIIGKSCKSGASISI